MKENNNCSICLAKDPQKNTEITKLNQKFSQVSKVIQQEIEVVMASLSKCRKILDEFEGELNGFGEQVDENIEQLNEQSQEVRRRVIRKKLDQLQLPEVQESAGNKESQKQPSLILQQQPFRSQKQKVRQKQTKIRIKTTPKLYILSKLGYTQFLVLQNSIIHIGRSDNPNQLALHHKILPIRNLHFRVRIVKSALYNIYIGIMAAPDCKGASSNNMICYYGVDGEIWDNGVVGKMGGGFNEGDTVEVRVRVGVVEWGVGGRVVARYESDRLREAGGRGVWYPVLEMRTTGDQVEWLG